MPTRWSLFAGVAGAVLLLLVALARLSAAAVEIGDDRLSPNGRSRSSNGRSRSSNGGAVRVDDPDGGMTAEQRFRSENGRPDGSSQLVDADSRHFSSKSELQNSEAKQFEPDEAPLRKVAEHTDSENERFRSEEQPGSGNTLRSIESMSTPALLANVALSQGVLGVVLVFGAWYAEVPLSAFGVVVGDPWSLGVPALAAGLGFGVVLYAANELLGNAVEDLGIDFSEELRGALAPDTAAGWLVLLVVVLPAIAVFEEVLFRGVLVGALAVGFGVSPWVLAIFSSAAFAVGHGMQGPGGVVVTGLLGFVLAAAFVVSGSLFVVVVAHYVVNALEFVVHEGLGWDPLRNEGGT